MYGTLKSVIIPYILASELEPYTSLRFELYEESKKLVILSKDHHKVLTQKMKHEITNTRCEI